MATQHPDQPQPVDTIEEDINHFFNRIVACVNFRRKTLLAEAKEKREEKRAKLERKEQSEKQLLATKTEIERNLKDNILQETQKEILAKLEEKLAEVRLTQPETRLIFQGDSEKLEQLILGLGEVVEQEVPVIPRYQDLRVTVAVGNEGLENGDLSSPSAIAIDENTNNIYVAQGDFFNAKVARVSIFSESGEFLDSFGKEHLSYPLGVAIHGNSVYVTDFRTDKLFQFKQDTDFSLVASVGGEGSEDGMFKRPTQVCVNTNGDVYVADYLNNRIQILNSSLQFLRTLSHQSMPAPSDIKLTQDEVYVLSTQDAHCIHVFSHTGEKIRSLLTRGKKKQQVTNASYFCLDVNQNIIISDFGASCIRVFSPKGTLLHTIGKPGTGKGMFDSPKGIALTKDLKLVVASNNRMCGLQIFSS